MSRDRDIHEQLTKYLTDAHAIEVMSLQQLKKAPDVSNDPGFSSAMREHLAETETHEARIRQLLEARGASTSKAKDMVLRAAGEGFVLFARSQTDSTGKLASHALSYEALEWGSYDLLARTADIAGEPDVALVAREIRDNERAMMDRIEASFDQTAGRSLEEATRDDLQELLISYLADAHAIEKQSIQLLESGKEMVDDYPTLRALFTEHLDESWSQKEILEERLEALGGSPSLLKDAAMRFGALNWGTFFLGHPDTPGKLVNFAHAFEHLEIGGYEQLRRVAQRAGDPETVTAAQNILAQERRTAQKLADAFDVAVRAALEEQGASGGKG
jgi:ferritin-like metal-binding protein YciE